VLVDTDIQYNERSLSRSTEDKIQDEIDFLIEKRFTVKTLESVASVGEIVVADFLNELGVGDGNTIIVIKNAVHELKNLLQKQRIANFTIDDKVIFILPEGVDRYNHIFKKDGKYSVEDTCV
jgi:hypothetical protein